MESQVSTVRAKSTRVLSSGRDAKMGAKRVAKRVSKDLIYGLPTFLHIESTR